MKTLSLTRFIAPALLSFVIGCDGTFSKGEGVTFFLEPLSGEDLALAPGGANLVNGASLADSVNAETKRAGLTWRVDNDAVHAVPEPYTAKSRQYWMMVDSSHLQQGLSISTTSAGAVVKLSPTQPSASPTERGSLKTNEQNAASPSVSHGSDAHSSFVHLSPININDLTLTDRNGITFDGVDAVEMAATSDEFKPSEIPFAAGTSVFKLRSELSIGELQLKSRAALSGAQYLVHVFEPNSDVVLSLQTTADTYLKGQELQFMARWSEGVTPKTATAEVKSPSGMTYNVTLDTSTGDLIGRLPLDEDSTKPGVLWEITVQAEAEGAHGKVLRSANTAFAYSLGTAALEQTVNVAEWPTTNDLKISFGVQAGSAGRYAVTGVLYGSTSTGELVPFLVSQAASTVGAGKDSVELIFSQAEIAASGLVAPFEVRDLRLLDQTRLGLLHRQWRALVLPL